MDPKRRVPPELEEAAEQIGSFIEYWGFKAIHGRIWTHLYLSPEPLDAAELIDRLGVSKALISISMADLLQYDVVRPGRKSERGTQTYEANPRVFDVILGVLRARERRMMSRLTAATRLLENRPSSDPRAVPLDPERVRSLSEMSTMAEQALDGFLQMQDVSFSPWTSLNAERARAGEENG